MAGGMEAKIGGLISSVQHATDALEELKRATKEDHDKLITLDSTWASDKKTVFRQIEEIKEKAEKALARAYDEAERVRLATTELVDNLREELQDGVKTKSDRLFHVLMAIGGVAGSLLTAWLLMKFGLAGGGSHASHGGG